MTRTRLAVAVSVAGLEEVMPRLEKRGPVFLHQRRNLVQFILRESAVRRHCHRIEPKLRNLPFPSHVNVWWLGPVAREKEEPVRAASENRRAHDADSVSFDRKPSRSVESAVTRPFGPSQPVANSGIHSPPLPW